MCIIYHNFALVYFRMLAERSEGFSGSDIVIVVRDACMEPVRKIRGATHFKRVSTVVYVMYVCKI